MKDFFVSLINHIHIIIIENNIRCFGRIFRALRPRSEKREKIYHVGISRSLVPLLRRQSQDESNLGFGKKFTDHMFVMDYTEGEGWHDPRIVPYGPFEAGPGYCRVPLWPGDL